MIIASIATFATVWVWLMILLSQIVMRRTLSPEETRQLSFPVPWWPVAPALATAFMAFVIGLLGYFEGAASRCTSRLVWIALLTVAYWLWVQKGGGSPVTRQRSRCNIASDKNPLRRFFIVPTPAQYPPADPRCRRSHIYPAGRKLAAFGDRPVVTSPF